MGNIQLKLVRLAILALSLSLAPIAANAQGVEGVLDQSFRNMYNLQFDAALQKAEAAKAMAREDPMPWVAQASAVLFREFNRLHILTSETFASDEGFSTRHAYSWDPASKKQFDDALNGADKLAQQRMAKNQSDPEALFALTLVNGLRADDAALITKKNLTALSYTKAATGFAERLLKLAPGYYDAYVATGLGKYIVGGKPAPVRWLLRLDGVKGDQEEGRKELRLAEEHGHYLAPFARILLAFDDLRRKDVTAARKKLASLHEQFPGNPLFLVEVGKLDASVQAGP
ncbi:MAG TPA: hypothetical protein VEW69_05590 [Alphaproteobacteria bacterium]|nr:hypothetical protein [Alphaproteobacteria bacterium]